jgi:hypothetical protein
MATKGKKKPAKKPASKTAAKVGRPSAFNTSFIERAKKLAMEGATDKQLADSFDVSEQTLNNWKKKYPEFLEALKKGKDDADSQVVASLFHRACGYSHPDVHISNFQGVITVTPITKHYPPDTTAAIFWLKNRKPEEWRDKMEHTGKDGKDLAVVAAVDPQDLARRIAFVFSQTIAAQGAQT